MNDIGYIQSLILYHREYHWFKRHCSALAEVYRGTVILTQSKLSVIQVSLGGHCVNRVSPRYHQPIRGQDNHADQLEARIQAS